MIQGVIAAAFVLPIARLVMGPIPALTLSHAGAVLLIVLLGSLAFSSLGMWLGTAIAPQQIGLMFSVIIAPMLFFGCAYYPWRGLDVVPVMKYVVLVNPMVYVSEGMRGALTPAVPHMPLAGRRRRADRRDGDVLDARHSQLLQASDWSAGQALRRSRWTQARISVVLSSVSRVSGDPDEHPKPRARLVALLALSSVAPAAAQAQFGVPAPAARSGIAGTVRDNLGHPVAGGACADRRQQALRRERRFRPFRPARPGARPTGFTITKIGYAPVSFETKLMPDSVIVVAIQLRAVQVLNTDLDQRGPRRRVPQARWFHRTPASRTRLVPRAGEGRFDGEARPNRLGFLSRREGNRRALRLVELRSRSAKSARLPLAVHRRSAPRVRDADRLARIHAGWPCRDRSLRSSVGRAVRVPGSNAAESG